MVVSKEWVLKERNRKASEERLGRMEEAIDNALEHDWVSGQQLVIPVTSQECDEPAIRELIHKYRKAGWKLDYNYDERRGKEYVLVYGDQR